MSVRRGGREDECPMEREGCVQGSRSFGTSGSTRIESLSADSTGRRSEEQSRAGMGWGRTAGGGGTAGQLLV